jgi:hypothetical protein
VLAPLAVLLLAVAALDNGAAATPASAPAPAASPGGLSAEPVFAVGMRYYDNFEFEKASFRFRSATRVSERPAAARARAFLWLGLALAQAGDDVGAREAFGQALALDGAVTLPEDAPPTIRAVFEESRAAPSAGGSTPSAATSSAATSSAATSSAATADPAAAQPGPSVLALAGAATAGVGGALVVAGAVAGAVAGTQADAAQKERFQDDALEAYGAAQTTAFVAQVLVGMGVAAAVVGAGLVVASAFLE